MKKYAILILLFVISFSITQAQDSSNVRGSYSSFSNYNEEELNHRLGFTASMLSGYGLSYEYFINPKLVLEVNGSIFGAGGESKQDAYNYNYTEPYLMASIGTELQYNLHHNYNSRFYLLSSLSYWHYSEDAYNYNLQRTVDEAENDYVIGLGIGLEYVVSKRLLFNIEGGYLYRNETDTGERAVYITGSNNYKAEAYKLKAYQFQFGVAVGAYYSF